MSNRLKQFVRDHREEFDGEEPDSKIWEAIRKDMGLAEDPNKKKPALVVRLSRATWAVAAAVVLLIVGTAWFLNTRQTPVNPTIAGGPKITQPATRPTPAPTASQNPALNPDSSHNNENLANNSGKDAGLNSELD